MSVKTVVLILLVCVIGYVVVGGGSSDKDKDKKKSKDDKEKEKGQCCCSSTGMIVSIGVAVCGGGLFFACKGCSSCLTQTTTPYVYHPPSPTPTSAPTTS
jgi:hypothetical protein